MAKKAASLPLDRVVAKVVNDLLKSHQWYKLASNNTHVAGIAKGIFDPEFGDGLAFDEIIEEAKRWLRKNGFTPVEILQNLDIHGGTLNYEGISILNDIEAAAYKGKLKQNKDHVVPMPSESGSYSVEDGDKICPSSRHTLEKVSRSMHLV